MKLGELSISNLKISYNINKKYKENELNRITKEIN